MIGWIRKVRAGIRDRGEYKCGPYGSFRHRFAIARWKWAAALCHFDEHWSLHVGCLWVRLWQSRSEPTDCMLDSWGFTFDNESRCLHLNWGHRTKIVYYPWSLEWVRTEHGMPDGSFVVTEQAGRLPRKWGGSRKNLRADGTLKAVSPDERAATADPHRDAPGRYRQEFPYRYTLKNGTVQERTAVVTVERMSWAYRLPYLLGAWWAAKVRTSIDVQFSDEVGERTGSWKGGCIGTGYDMLSGETPEACLRRMERERVFD